MFKESKVGAVCFYVSDIARSERFYRDILGLDIQRMDDDGHGNQWLMATTPNEVELLFIVHETRPGNSPVVTFDLPDGGIDDVVAEMAGQSVTIVTPVS